jgi:hypothetical protein
MLEQVLIEDRFGRAAREGQPTGEVPGEGNRMSMQVELSQPSFRRHALPRWSRTLLPGAPSRDGADAVALLRHRIGR